MRTKGPVTAPRTLYTTADVARFCKVDLRTIQAWAAKGAIAFIRTPGRHRRFRAAEVVRFLNAQGYVVPDELPTSKPRLVVIDRDRATAAGIKRTLGRRYAIRSFGDPVDALVELGTLRPRVLVLDLDCAGLDALHFLSRLRSLSATSRTSTVVLTSSPELAERAMEEGAVDACTKDDPRSLHEVLENLAGKSA